MAASLLHGHSTLALLSGVLDQPSLLQEPLMRQHQELFLTRRKACTLNKVFLSKIYILSVCLCWWEGQSS